MADTELAVKYTAADGTEIAIDKNYVNLYLLTGGGSDLTDADTVKFFNICKIMGANPLVNDIWPIKVGDQPASVIISKQFQEKMADRNPNYDGSEHGVIIQYDGKMEWVDGACVPDGVKLIGGWCRAYRKDRSRPITVTVPLSGYQSNNVKSRWHSDPAGMIEKVAYDHALREAFPNQLGGVYCEEEMEQAQDGPVAQVIEADMVEPVPEPVPEKPKKRLLLKADSALLRKKAEKIAKEIGTSVDDIRSRMMTEVGDPRDVFPIEVYLKAVDDWAKQLKAEVDSKSVIMDCASEVVEADSYEEAEDAK